YRIQSLQDLQNIPITASGATRPEILADVATLSRSSEVPVVTHYNIRRTLDVYANVQDRDLGSVAHDVQRIIDQNSGLLARGNFVHMRGQVETMNSSYIGLLFGLVFSIVLVYLLIVVNFQSWLDPFIIITALPAAISGIVLFLFFTRTTLSVPALMGAIIGMIPMALGLGDGGEQNAPLGRAVIGGLTLATIATLIFVPAVFALLHGRGHRQPQEPTQEAEHVYA